MRTRSPRIAVRNELAQLAEAERIVARLRAALEQVEAWRETIVAWKGQAVAVAQDHEQRIRALEAKVP